MTGTQKKLRVALLFGGRSPEHDVSVCIPKLWP